ncbi:MAG: universal stress protein [Actinobacteria bacterium]|nr:universal stress protein [Actinomycetota bacterium]
MTRAIVVGFRPAHSASDALALGVRLARSAGAHLHVVTVLPPEGGHTGAVPEGSAETAVQAQARARLEEGIAGIPEGVAHSGHVRVAESFAEGLVEAAEECGARLIVVGAANGGLFGYHRIGSVAGELLHSSPVPVALAPAGFARGADDDVSRVTAAVGTRPGADVLLDAAVALAAMTGGGLRLISLVPFDVPAGLGTGAIRLIDDALREDVLAKASAALPAGIEPELEHAPGDTVEEAVAHLSWLPGEVLVVGSSRLAQPRRLFLGSTAAKMLSVLPVPMIVVPRTSHDPHPDGSAPEPAA